MLNLKHSAVEYKNRVFGYDAETRAAFIVFFTALINAVLCAIATFTVAVYLIARKKGGVLLTESNRLTLIFGMLTFIVSAVYLNYFGIIGGLFFLAVMIVCLNFKENISKQKLDDIFTLAIVYSVFALAVALVQKIFDLSAISGRSESTFMNALYYCYYISFVILICMYRIIYENRNKILYISLIVLNLFAMLVTASKMPIVAILVAMCAMLFFAKKFKILIPLCVLGVIGVAALWLLRDYGIAEKLQMNGFIDSFKMRFPYWEQAITGFKEKPIYGHGILGFLKESVDNSVVETGYKFDILDITESLDNLKHVGWHLHAHNLLFDCLYNYGLVGSVMLAIIVVKRIRELYKSSGKNILDPMMTLTLSCFVFILLDGVVDCQIIGIQTLFISVFLFSVTGIYKNREEKIYEIQ